LQPQELLLLVFCRALAELKGQQLESPKQEQFDNPRSGERGTKS
jgi:hypothetical protein